nr:ribonuclease H-like domain-containing protein [Tanacetum cinerariifolium]
MFDFDDYCTSESDESLPLSPIYDRYESSNGYHVVPPPYTGTFMPPKPDLVFHNSPNDVETVHTAFNVELSPTKPDNDMSHTHRPSAPIIEDWVSDSKDESKTKIPQYVASFVQPTEQVNTPRPSVEHVETSIPTANPKTAIPNPTSNGNHRNKKACFLPVTTAVPKPTVTRPRPAKPIVTKPTSPPRRHINRRPSPKAWKIGMETKIPNNRPCFSKYKFINDPQKGNPQHALKEKGVIDSGCLRHITQNMSYLSDFKKLNGGYVSFGGNPKGGKISGKGKIRTGKLDFDDVYFVKELKFNLFSVSQMCDKNNSVLFTDTKCLVLSLEFKPPDENQVFLRVPKENNMYSVNLKNIVPSRDLTFLFAKATLDESNLWHRRLVHINFKTTNKLVKCNIVRGLPSKVFEDDHTCVACKKGKQHRASCKTKLVSSVNQPLQRLHMDLFKPTFVKSLNKKSYCLVVTDDYSRVLVTKPQNKTPYELLHGRTLSIGFMRPFGCPVTILNTLDSLGKFDGKVDEGFLVGYSISSKAFRVFNSKTRIVQETLHINFLENKPNVVGSGHTWLLDIDTLTKTMNYQPITAGNQSNPSACVQEQFAAKKEREENVQQYVLFPVWSSGSINPQNTYGDATFDEKEPEFEGRKHESEINVSPSSSAQSKKHDDKTKRKAKGKNPDNVAGTLVPAVGKISTNNTNTFSVAELEDITYSDDEDDVGAEADFTNLETSITVSPIPTTRVHKDHPVTQIIGDLSSATQTRSMTRVAKGQEVFAPVVRIEAIRLFLAYASFMGFMVYQMDVKGAFLYETIKEEVYVCQPLGFEDPNYPDKIYVADIIFGYTNKDLCKAFEKLMKDKFQMSSMGELTFFLGFQVKQKKDGIFISLDKYVADILRKFGLTDGKSASTPIDTKKPLLKDPDGKDVDVHTYRSMIGSFMYLTSSRPDIMFAVYACAHFQVTPKASHLHAVKRIFRYLKDKPYLGLWYPKDSPFNLVAYSDSDYAGASLGRKSTIGECQFLGCRLISWQCKKQTVVATSSTEAEYVAT